MTPPLPRRKQLLVIKLFFQGLSYQQIQKHAKAGEGSIKAIVERLRTGQYTEFADLTEMVDTLRETAIFVKKELDGDLERAHIGSAAYAGLRRLGIDPAEVKDIAALFEELSPPGMPRAEFVKTALACRRLAERLGVNVEDLPERVASLEERHDALRAEVDAQEAEAKTLRSDVDALRQELGLLKDIKGLRAERLAEQTQVAEVRGRKRATLADAKVTDEALERFRVFSGTMSSKGVPVNEGTCRTLIDLVATLGPAGILMVERLGILLDDERLDAGKVISIFGNLQRQGFTARQADAVVRALGGKGSFPARVRRLVSLFEQHGSMEAAVASEAQELEGLRAQKSGIRTEIARLQGEQSILTASIQELHDEERRTIEGVDTRQREADERLRATEERHRKLEVYSGKLGARNIEQAGEITARNEQLATLRDEVRDTSRQRDETKARLQEAMGIEADWDELQRSLGSARDTGAREVKELGDLIQEERDTLALAGHLKFALGGDPRYARSVFAHYAREPTLYPGLRDPVPSPEGARDRLVEKAFELLGTRAVRREEHERAAEAHKSEVDRLTKDLEAKTTVIKDSERKLKARDEEKRALEVELHGTKKRLEWSEEFRAELVAQQRRGPASQRK